MLKTLNYLSFPGGIENTHPIGAAIAAATEHGYQGLELCVGDSGVLTLGATKAECEAIAGQAAEAGIALPSVCSGLYWSRSLGDDDPAKRDQAESDVRKMLQISAWLGAKTLLVIPGAVDVFFLPERPAQSYDQVWQNALEGLRALAPEAERLRVRIGLENVWNKFLLSPVEMSLFLDQCGSEWIGAYLDVGNVLPFGYPEQWIRILGPRLVGVHFKDFRRSVGTADGFVDLLEGDVNWPEVVKALREVGYSGAVAAEMIPIYAHHSMTRIAAASRAMDAILSG
jgi:L-ribulose-5-phosphate 3-epimerase